jgi:hypothetical protein
MEVQSKLRSLQGGQGEANVDSAEYALASFSVTLALGAAVCNNGQSVCDDLLCLIHLQTFRLFTLCSYILLR